MAFAGAKQALPVIYILLLISVLTAVWMAAGTVPALVYYGTQLISPRFFILWAFLLSSSLWPLTLSIIFYTALSLHQPQLTVQIADSAITTELPKVFNLSLITLLPTAIILLLAVGRVNVKLAMLASIGTGIAIAHTLQQVPLLSIIQFSLFWHR